MSRIKRAAAAIAVLLAVFATISGCGVNDSIRDLYGIVRLPNGEIVEGKAEDYFLGSASFVYVTIDGKDYKTHASNVCIIETYN